jgi:hypothetical protein
VQEQVLAPVMVIASPWLQLAVQLAAKVLLGGKATRVPVINSKAKARV